MATAAGPEQRNRSASWPPRERDVRLGMMLTLFLSLNPASIFANHVQLQVGYPDNRWHLHLFDFGSGVHEASAVPIRVEAAALTEVPQDPRFAEFLGPAGRPVWILPQQEHPDLVFLGLSAEGIRPGLFERNEIKLTLKSVTGPGQFALFASNPFGGPRVIMNTRDGLDERHDSLTLSAGAGHLHADWAFSAPGTYKLRLEAAGKLTASGQLTESGPVEYTFLVLAEPQGAGQARLTELRTEHADFRAVYDSALSAFTGIVVRDGDRGVDYQNTELVLVVAEAAKVPLPAGTPFGREGEPLWVLPQTQDPNLLYLGVSAEALPAGVFAGPIDFRLRSVEGPGNFFAWQASALGGIELKMSSADGISEADKTMPLLGSHEHFNFGFTTSGVYRVTFQASGRRIGESTNIVSPETAFTFHVLPLPLRTPFQIWQRTHWPDVAHGDVDSPSADPDADGLVNLVEYTLDLNPRIPDRSGSLTSEITTDGGVRYGAITFTRSLTATDVRLRVEVSEELIGPWAELTHVVSRVTTSPAAAERVQVRDRLPLGHSPHRFYRVRIDWAEPRR